MKEQILPHMEVIETMRQAMHENGVTPVTLPIRGGTDGAPAFLYGSSLSQHLYPEAPMRHGKQEYVVVDDMEKIKDIIKTAVYITP